MTETNGNISNRIERLGSVTVNQIAAGEVVERPVSIVKELVENALDAGGDRIKISIQDGGLSLIRVTDNGSGIDSRDLPLAVERHATSKLRRIEDLEDLSTLGFRGEALASVSSVAEMEIVTRRAGDISGYRLRISGDERKPVIEKTGCPEGTQVTVERLFYNTPARLKFMRTGGYEAGLIHDLVIQMALGYPRVGFVLENHGKLVLDTNELNRAEDLIELFYGKEARRSLVAVNGTASKAAVTGWITAPPFSRGTRKGYHVFINGRWVSVNDYRWSIERAFEYTLPKGRFPVCVLYLRIPGDLLDVNVHPGKLEVRVNDPGMNSGLTSALRFAISGGQVTPELPYNDTYNSARDSASPDSSPPVNSTPDSSTPSGYTRDSSTLSGFTRDSSPPNGFTPDSSPYDSSSPGVSHNARYPRTGDDGRAFSGKNPVQRWESLFDLSALGEQALDSLLNDNAGEIPAQPGETFASPDGRLSDVSHTAKAISDIQAKSQTAEGWGVRGHNAALRSMVVESGRQDFVFTDAIDFAVIGQLHNTFILAQTNEGLLIADQHVVHERILYENLLEKSAENTPAQMLIKPVRVDLSTGEEENLIQNIIALSDSGLIFERFGPRQYLLRSEPVGYSVDETMVRELLETLDKSGEGDRTTSAKQTLMILSACKAAVKANTALTIGEMTALLDGLRRTKYPMTCPHGRPIMYLLPYRRLIQVFGRL